MKLRKIPLEAFIEILQQLFEDGADYIDINGEQNINSKDIIKITVRPEYFIHTEDEIDDELEEELETDYYYEEEDDTERNLSEDDLNALI
tara:strand:- start:13803 stop:14072 length:270 start_codon:yes stop_codon:yes gene_type:complete